MAHLVNDTPQVSMVKDTDGPTVWSDGPRNLNDLETDGRCTDMCEYTEESIVYIVPHAPLHN